MTVDPPSQSGYASAVPPVAMRVREIIDRTGWSERELARQSNLSPGAINWILSHPNQEVKRRTIHKIAQGTNHSIAWLASGEGSYEDPWVEPREDEALAEPVDPRPVRPTRPRMPAPEPKSSTTRQELIDNLTGAIASLTREGDKEGARIALEALNRLMGAGDVLTPATRSVETATVEESGMTRKFAG